MVSVLMVRIPMVDILVVNLLMVSQVMKGVLICFVDKKDYLIIVDMAPM
jgi:hypothetical protein